MNTKSIEHIGNVEHLTINPEEFEMDMLTFINMYEGMLYDKAVLAAHKEFRELHELEKKGL